MNVFKYEDNWNDSAQWCQDFGGQQKFTGSLLIMINNCISGPASPRTHLLQNWQFGGALVLHLMAFLPNPLMTNIEFLTKTVLSHNGLDMLMFTKVPLAGYHEINRN